jgi:hypothetical protein
MISSGVIAVSHSYFFGQFILISAVRDTSGTAAFLAAIIRLSRGCYAVHSPCLRAKEQPARRKGPGRPSKGKIQATFRLSPIAIDALSRVHEETERDKSDLAEEALIDYLSRTARKSRKPE